MIDVFGKDLITLAQAAEQLPRDRAGRKVNVSTLIQWATRGSRGVVLESVRLGRAWCTTREAVNAFASAQARPRAAKAVEGPTPSAERANREMEAMGL